MSSQRSSAIQSEAVNLRTVILAGVIAVAGVVLLTISVQDWAVTSDGRANPWSTVLSQLGGVLVASGVLTVAWEGLVRRAFAREVFATARLSSEVVDAGMVGVPRDFQTAPWDEWINDAKSLDMVVGYARTWRNAHQAALRALAARGTLRVYLPDPDHEQTVASFAARIGEDPDETQKRIREAVRDFGALGDKVQVWVRPGTFSFTAYRFDRRSVLALYSHTGERGHPVPALVVNGGGLGDFANREIDAIHKQSRQVLPDQQ